jgi:GntR family transcriptional regulator / MocR family aminotransferase
MEQSWAIPVSGLDLLLELDPRLGRRAALERALRQAIRDGRLQPGTRLPSSRTLSQDVGLARGTVSEAYRQLVTEGYLVARQGAGTTVAPGPGLPPAPSLSVPPVDRARWDLEPGQPDLSGFPRDLWLTATRRVLRGAGNDAFGYGDPRGRPELRRALADYLGRARGVLTSPDLIVVCSGYAQGLALLCQALRAGGATTVAHEDPCMPVYPAIITRAGLRPGSVAVDADGVQVERLAGLAADAVVVTPAHQFPLGPTLAAARRAELVGWARDADALVIEDDYDGEFRYDRQPVGAVQGLDPQRVVYAGTASKTLAPGLRLAWLALPAWLLEPVIEGKRLADRHSAVVDQLVLADLLASGAFDRHLRRCRLRYRRRRDRLAAALAERAPALKLAGVAAGLHAVLLLPEQGPSEQEVVAAAAACSVAVDGLGLYWHSAGPRPAGLVVGYATPPEHAFTGALDALAATLTELYQDRTHRTPAPT